MEYVITVHSNTGYLMARVTTTSLIEAYSLLALFRDDRSDHIVVTQNGYSTIVFRDAISTIVTNFDAQPEEMNYEF